MTRAAVFVAALVLAGLASAAGPTPGGRPVVLRGCDPLYYERVGMPQRLIVSDLPMEDTAHTAMHQMTQAIKLTLKTRGFRAGRFSVGYVACDDSGATGRWSAARCAHNARLATRHPHVVGVIGTLDSGCARAELPALGRGGLLLVSPLNTADDLTGGRAAVARLSATDSAQAAAAARFIEGTGARRVAALSDGTPRGESSVPRSRARLRGRTAPRARPRRRRIRRRRARRADARDDRGRTAARRRRPARALVRLRPGCATRRHRRSSGGGPYLFVAGVPVERLGGPGRDFVRRFEESIGRSPHPYAVYAAQAAELLLDAVAHSDGSRAAVTARCCGRGSRMG